jgi:nitroimidazol reductase NimA-like FMN-containing flavoprotein (pyridoxamine 5'-phosphate oxidase superfamily)
MNAAPAHLAELNRETCLHLLGTATVGRVGVSIDALPAVFPVFLTVLDDAVVFRTVPGTKLAAAANGSIVAVEADEFDAETGEGWSVLVRGVAREMDRDGRAAAARRFLKRTWIDDAAEHLIEVSTDLVTGRRIH